MKRLIRRVQKHLTPDLLRGQWRKQPPGNPLSGHCYVAAEALWHLLGGRDSGYIPCVLNHNVWPEGLDPGETHWFLRKGKAVADPTAEQFEGQAIAYAKGIPCGFLTRQPSKRASKVMAGVLAN